MRRDDEVEFPEILYVINQAIHYPGIGTQLVGSSCVDGMLPVSDNPTPTAIYVLRRKTAYKKQIQTKAIITEVPDTERPGQI